MGRNNIFSRWWRTIDKLLLITIILIAVIGIILIISASPAIAHRIKLPSTHFIYRHLIYLSISFFAMFIISLFNELQIRYLAVFGFVISTLLLIIVLYTGTEIKGAYRWLQIFRISIQPSEFAKTYFVAFNAIILSRNDKLKYVWSFLTYLVVATLIVSEPDVGMTIIITMIFIGQLFVCGVGLRYIVLSGVLTLMGGLTAYFTIPHIEHRINNFLSPSIENNFQVNKSLEAFKNGGLLGRGPGEGTVKSTIPDSHTDFIFAVAAEELGAFFCLLIIILFLFLAIRTLYHISYSKNLFNIIIITGLVIEIVGPAVINMGVSLHLLPTKGMVLPFISYGGSCILASSIALGIMLSLTKTKFFAAVDQ